MMLSFQKITKYFGVEVDGVALTQLLADRVLAEIWDAFDEYFVLVFHDQAFGDDTQIAFSLNFEPLEQMRKTKPGGGKHISDIPTIVLASMLPGRIMPPEDAGTEFANQRAAYAAMSPAEQARLDGLVVVHSFEYSRNFIDKDMLTDAMRVEHSPIKHALVRAGPTVSEDGMSLSAA